MATFFITPLFIQISIYKEALIIYRFTAATIHDVSAAHFPCPKTIFHPKLFYKLYLN